jgi:hypothetical protein
MAEFLLYTIFVSTCFHFSLYNWMYSEKQWQQNKDILVFHILEEENVQLMKGDTLFPVLCFQGNVFNFFHSYVFLDPIWLIHIVISSQVLFTMEVYYTQKLNTPLLNTVHNSYRILTLV